ncbi:hypothetical protein ACLMAL_28715 [Nocardia sp. CWNU-33]
MATTAVYAEPRTSPANPDRSDIASGGEHLIAQLLAGPNDRA